MMFMLLCNCTWILQQRFWFLFWGWLLKQNSADQKVKSLCFLIIFLLYITDICNVTLLIFKHFASIFAAGKGSKCCSFTQQHIPTFGKKMWYFYPTTYTYLQLTYKKLFFSYKIFVQVHLNHRLTNGSPVLYVRKKPLYFVFPYFGHTLLQRLSTKWSRIEFSLYVLLRQMRVWVL